MKIILLNNNEIDIEKYDQCVSNAYNHFIYAESWYLNIVSPGWKALVFGDYEVVMPIPIKDFIIFKKVIQPAWTQQLGLFSRNEIINHTVDDFLIFLRKKYKFITYNLNEKNDSSFPVDVRPNYILDLNNPYEELKTLFSNNTLRNIKKSQATNLEIELVPDYENLTPFFKENSPEKLSGKAYNTFSSIYQESIKRNKGELWLAKKYNEVIAVCFLLKSPGRLIYRLGISSQAGKEDLAMFALLHDIIQKYSEQPVLLDFEGSSIEGIARFYKGFGAINRNYYTFKTGPSLP